MQHALSENLADWSVCGKIILKWISIKYGKKMCTISTCVNIGSRAEAFVNTQWTFGFLERQGISTE
jgi:hypothetical protein